MKSEIPLAQYETVIQTNLNSGCPTVKECLEQMVNFH